MNSSPLLYWNSSKNNLAISVIRIIRAPLNCAVRNKNIRNFQLQQPFRPESNLYTRCFTVRQSQRVGSEAKQLGKWAGGVRVDLYWTDNRHWSTLTCLMIFLFFRRLLLISCHSRTSISHDSYLSRSVLFLFVPSAVKYLTPLGICLAVTPVMFRAVESIMKKEMPLNEFHFQY